VEKIDSTMTGTTDASHRKASSAFWFALPHAIPDSKSNNSGTSSVSTSIFNLGKTILGAGVLSLPSGIATFTDSANGIMPAVAVLTTVGVVSAYSFKSIGKACERFGARSFSEAWAKSVDQRTGSLLNIVVVVNTFLSCLTYSIIIGE
jgi:sodium-coupled neutral amino acid transporter 11